MAKLRNFYLKWCNFAKKWFNLIHYWLITCLYRVVWDKRQTFETCCQFLYMVGLTWQNGIIRPFYKARAPVRLTQERPKCALHHGKMSTNKCRARYEITHEHVSNDLKMWIKRLHTEIHIIITIYIHYKSIYFKIITCIILGLVNLNVFSCKTISAFNDFVDSCVTGKHNRTGARAL